MTHEIKRAVCVSGGVEIPVLPLEILRFTIRLLHCFFVQFIIQRLDSVSFLNRRRGVLRFYLHNRVVVLHVRQNAPCQDNGRIIGRVFHVNDTVHSRTGSLFTSKGRENVISPHLSYVPIKPEIRIPFRVVISISL